MSAKKVTLLELKVADLKRELEERECDVTGKKSVLQDRLRQQLEMDGENADTYLFEIACDINTAMQNLKGELGSLKGELGSLKGELMENMEQKLLENANNLKSEIMEHSKYVDKKFKSMEQEILQMREEMENKLAALNVRQGDENQSQVSAEHSELHSETEVRLRMKPPQFDGKTSWANYILQFEAAARANGWTTAEKATALTLALRGDATDILQTLSEVEQRDYQQLVRKLDMRYGQAHLEQVYHSQLKNRVQRAKETLQEFEADIARLVRLAYAATPENVLERLAVQAFIDGLRDHETRQALILARPTTLMDALARGLEFEAAKTSSRCQAQVRVIDENREDGCGTSEATLRRLVDEALEKRRRVQCWNCGKLGHIRRRCPEGTGKPRDQTISVSEN